MEQLPKGSIRPFSPYQGDEEEEEGGEGSNAEGKSRLWWSEFTAL